MCVRERERVGRGTWALNNCSEGVPASPPHLRLEWASRTTVRTRCTPRRMAERPLPVHDPARPMSEHACCQCCWEPALMAAEPAGVGHCHWQWHPGLLLGCCLCRHQLSSPGPEGEYLPEHVHTQTESVSGRLKSSAVGTVEGQSFSAQHRSGPDTCRLEQEEEKKKAKLDSESGDNKAIDTTLHSTPNKAAPHTSGRLAPRC